MADDLHPGNTIFMRVSATNSIGTGYSSEITFAVPNLGAPTNFAVSGNGILTWTLGQYTSETWIVRGTSATPTTTTDGVVIFQTIGTTFTDANPNPDSVTYYYAAYGYFDGIPDDGDGDIDVFWSPTSSTISNGGTAMASLSNNFLIGILLIFAFTFLTLGYMRKSFFLTMISFIACLLLGGFSMSVRTGNNIYYGIGYFAIFMALVALITSIGLAWSGRNQEEMVDELEETATQHKANREAKRGKWAALRQEKRNRGLFK